MPSVFHLRRSRHVYFATDTHRVVIRVDVAHVQRQSAHNTAGAVGHGIFHSLDLKKGSDRRFFYEIRLFSHLLLFAEEPSQTRLNTLLLLTASDVSVSGRRLQHVHRRHTAQVSKRLLAAMARAQRRRCVVSNRTPTYSSSFEAKSK